MKEISGPRTNRINQLVVKETLQTTRDENIFVIGGCAACPQPDGKFIPAPRPVRPQMATQAFKNILPR